MNEITVAGRVYVDLGRAAHETSYDREYLRKMAKSGKVEAVQIGDVWMVNLDSLNDYRKAKPQRKPHGAKSKARAK